jgi:hypothetical protein
MIPNRLKIRELRALLDDASARYSDEAELLVLPHVLVVQTPYGLDLDMQATGGAGLYFAGVVDLANGVNDWRPDRAREMATQAVAGDDA